ncbi:SAM-dependent methyltransferase [Saxibacter everestensis]|uniref:SAM-dependent methyltransferase n=1 Tax=Saxibacter everestensis TaxID=2909229 RepID=A0ABY8QSY3_9MICO|nr:SAM-dependent methyltransferase [Brevibacteriaceae bacterium ZFBP1038]
MNKLACPICQQHLTHDPSTLSCPAGHAFDIARQGYVSLLRGGKRATTGDDAAMVAARDAFLNRGHYEPVASAISASLPDNDGLCVDLAGGTGYYLQRVLEDRPGMVGASVDLSKFAVRRAAGRHPRIAAISADVWQPLPFRSGTAEYVLSIFGPRNPGEIKRILNSGGTLLVVTPTERHLRELVDSLGLIGVDPSKESRLAEQLSDFTRISRRTVEYTVAMDHDDVRNDVLMGPSIHHIDQADFEHQVAALPEQCDVTVSVQVALYRP